MCCVKSYYYYVSISVLLFIFRDLHFRTKPPYRAKILVGDTPFWLKSRLKPASFACSIERRCHVKKLIRNSQIVEQM